MATNNSGRSRATRSAASPPPRSAEHRGRGVNAAERERGRAQPDRMGTAVQTAAALVAVSFLGVGLFGFIPGLVTDLDSMSFAGHESTAQLFGVFEVSVLHNLVHVLYGVVGLVSALSWSAARAFLVGGGVVYLALWLYGLIVQGNADANFIPVNEADNWLHLGLGLGMLLFGLLLDRDRAGLRAGRQTMGR